MRNPKYNKHAQRIAEYVNDCGVIALTQEIRFLLGDGEVDQQILAALVKFQKELTQIQEARIRNATGEVKWLMAK